MDSLFRDSNIYRGYKWRISEDGKDSPVLPFDSALWSMTNEFESVASTWTHNLKPSIRHAVIRFVLSREITGGRALIPSPRFRAPKFFNENLRTFPARRDGQFSIWRSQRIDRVASHERTFVVIERIGAITRKKVFNPVSGRLMSNFVSRRAEKTASLFLSACVD